MAVESFFILNSATGWLKQFLLTHMEVQRTLRLWLLSSLSLQQGGELLCLISKPRICTSRLWRPHQTLELQTTSLSQSLVMAYAAIFSGPAQAVQRKNVWDVQKKLKRITNLHSQSSFTTTLPTLTQDSDTWPGPSGKEEAKKSQSISHFTKTRTLTWSQPLWKNHLLVRSTWTPCISEWGARAFKSLLKLKVLTTQDISTIKCFPGLQSSLPFQLLLQFTRENFLASTWDGRSSLIQLTAEPRKKETPTARTTFPSPDTLQPTIISLTISLSRESTTMLIRSHLTRDTSIIWNHRVLTKDLQNTLRHCLPETQSQPTLKNSRTLMLQPQLILRTSKLPTGTPWDWSHHHLPIPKLAGELSSDQWIFKLLTLKTPLWSSWLLCSQT